MVGPGKQTRLLALTSYVFSVRPPSVPTALSLCLALIGAAVSRAQFVTPTSYDYGSTPPSTTGPSGPTNIYPDAGHELTDGVLGLSFNHYANELEADVWTGWANVAPTISFQFTTMQTFSRVEIGTNRMDGNGIPALASVTIAGSPFTTGVALPDVTRDWLAFDGSFSTSLVGGVPTLTLSLTSTAPAQWIMLDEVRFTSAIPEPAESVLLIALLGATALIVRRRKFPPSNFA